MIDEKKLVRDVVAYFKRLLPDQGTEIVVDVLDLNVEMVKLIDAQPRISYREEEWCD